MQLTSSTKILLDLKFCNLLISCSQFFLEIYLNHFHMILLILFRIYPAFTFFSPMTKFQENHSNNLFHDFYIFKVNTQPMIICHAACKFNRKLIKSNLILSQFQAMLNILSLLKTLNLSKSYVHSFVHFTYTHVCISKCIQILFNHHPICMSTYHVCFYFIMHNWRVKLCLEFTITLYNTKKKSRMKRCRRKIGDVQ